jgi:transposase InsO family protein
VQRQFTTDAPNRIWLTGITEHPTGEGKLYLCAIKDACSGRIADYSMNSQMKASLAVSALRHAIALRSPRRDSGGALRPGQFRSHAYVRAQANGLAGLMGRAGACGDNAAMESFYPAAKNVLDRKRWDIRMQLLLVITTWIERTYRRRRRQRRLGKANTCRIRDALHHGRPPCLTRQPASQLKQGQSPLPGCTVCGAGAGACTAGPGSPEPASSAATGNLAGRRRGTARA